MIYRKPFQGRPLRLLTVVFLAVALFAGAIGGLAALGDVAHAAPNPQTSYMFNLTTLGRILVNGSSDVNQLTVQGHTTQTNNLLVLEQSNGTDVLTVTNAGNLFQTGLNIGSSDQITGTDGQTITPTKSLYILDSATDITITLAACAHNNQPLALFGNDANTILVADSDLRSTDGAAISIGQYDLVALRCIGAEWIHQSTSANE